MARTQINLRVEPETKAAWEREAKKHRLSLTELIAQAIDQFSNTDPKIFVPAPGEVKKHLKTPGITCKNSRCHRVGACTCGFKPPGSE